MLSLIYSFKLYIFQDPRIARAYTAQNTKKSALLACLAQRPSARLYCGGQLLQATLSGPCRACLVSHPWQLVPYAGLGLGRDGANNLASSRLESWALDGSSVEITNNAKLSFRYHEYRTTATAEHGEAQRFALLS